MCEVVQAPSAKAAATTQMRTTGQNTDAVNIVGIEVAAFTLSSSRRPDSTGTILEARLAAGHAASTCPDTLVVMILVAVGVL